MVKRLPLRLLKLLHPLLPLLLLPMLLLHLLPLPLLLLQHLLPMPLLLLQSKRASPIKKPAQAGFFIGCRLPLQTISRQSIPSCCIATPTHFSLQPSTALNA